MVGALRSDVPTLFELPLARDIQKVLKTISRSGVPDILFVLSRGPHRFSEIMFKTRLNPGILDRHLRALRNLGIVEKRDNAYELTEKGRQVVGIVESIGKLF